MRENISEDRSMNTTETGQAESKSEIPVTDEERAILLERRKTLAEDKKKARPSDEVFQRILQKHTP
jgi:hypothetical protein